jgi:hypothetical protein
MNFFEASPNGLLSMYKAIALALHEDDQLPAGEKKFGVREFSDWRA